MNINDKQLQTKDKVIIVASGLAIGICAVTAVVAAPVEIAATALAVAVGGAAVKRCYKDDSNE